MKNYELIPHCSSPRCVGFSAKEEPVDKKQVINDIHVNCGYYVAWRRSDQRNIHTAQKGKKLKLNDRNTIY